MKVMLEMNATEYLEKYSKTYFLLILQKIQKTIDKIYKSYYNIKRYKKKLSTSHLIYVEKG